ncbi:MAG: PQQ-like beta-propeller repeat protein [Phycisphaerales bacterium]|nr:PQQ-like beta-propeller repeat protein [Phycisphaerales bacterium]
MRGSWIGVMLLVCGTVAWADDWPQWRGPQRDGVWRESGLVDSFAGAEIPAVWRAPIGSGYSGPTVADGRVFVTDRVLEPSQRERVHCFDAKSGKSLWSFAYDCPYRGVDYDAGPRASVLVDDGRAYALGTMGHLHCFDAATGKIVWQRDLAADFAVRMPMWGIAASPVIEGDVLIAQIGGAPDACLVGLDKRSGKEIWRALPDPASYSAPIVIDQAGKRVLVCYTGERVVGLDPQTGRLYWSSPFPPARMIIGVATPVHYRNYIFVTDFFSGSLLLRLDPDALQASEVWKRRGESEQKTDALHSIIATPLIIDDHIYGMDSYGELRCLQLATGDRVWEDLTVVPRARWAMAHLVRNDDKVWIFNEKGELIIGRLSPQGFTEIDRAKLIKPTLEQLRRRGGVCWSHPAFADRNIFVRNDEEIVCADLAAPGHTP